MPYFQFPGRIWRKRRQYNTDQQWGNYPGKFYFTIFHNLTAMFVTVMDWTDSISQTRAPFRLPESDLDNQREMLTDFGVEVTVLPHTIFFVWARQVVFPSNTEEVENILATVYISTQASERNRLTCEVCTNLEWDTLSPIRFPFFKYKSFLGKLFTPLEKCMFNRALKTKSLKNRGFKHQMATML